MFHRILCAAGLMACLSQPAFADHAAVSFGGHGAGPINAVSAATMPQGALAATLATTYRKSSRFSDAELAALAGQHIHAHSTDRELATTIGFHYGLDDDLTLGLHIPLIHRDNVRAGAHSHASGAVTNRAVSHGDVTGWGDLALHGKYRFWDSDNLQASLLLGIKAPTGRQDVMHDFEKLEAEHQPGTGSWDAMTGLAAGTMAGNVALDASALYHHVTKGAQDTDLGDRLHYGLAASYRISGESRGHGAHVSQGKGWDLMLELNGEWMNQKKTAGHRDNNSGGNVIFLAPGARFFPNEKWNVQLSVGVPVIENIGRGHTETDYKITAGISRMF